MEKYYEAHIIYRDREQRDEVCWAGHTGESIDGAIAAAREQMAFDSDREYLRIEVFRCEPIATEDV